MLTLLTCVHVVTFKMAHSELFAFYFSLNDSIDLYRVSATQADCEDVIHHGEGRDADAALVLIDSFVLIEAVLANGINLNRTFYVGYNRSLHF